MDRNVSKVIDFKCNTTDLKSVDCNFKKPSHVAEIIYYYRLNENEEWRMVNIDRIDLQIKILTRT